VVLAIVCTGVMLVSLDLFIVNLALPKMAEDFGGASLSSLSWVLNAYAIVFAALLVLAGRLADRSSRTRGFLLGVAIFAAASAACAASTGVGMLVAFRAVQAVGAAILIPTSLGLVLATYPADKRGRAVRIWTATGGLAAGLGPVLGGLLVTLDWRWIFLVNVPVGIAALVIGARLLPDAPGDRGPIPDVLGTALLTVSIGALTLGLVKGNDWGWASAEIVGLLAASAVAALLFTLRSSRHASPVVDLGLLRVRAFSVTLVAMLLFSTAFGAMLLSVVLWAQDGWGHSALRAGLEVAPGPLMVPPTSLLAGILIARFGPGRVVAAGCGAFGAGVLWWVAAVGPQPHYLDLLGGMIITGIGVGLTLPTLFSTAAASVPPQRFATGSAVVSMVRQIGFAVGVAVFVAVLGTPRLGPQQLSAYQRSWWTIAIVAFAAAASGLLLRRPRPAAVTPTPLSTAQATTPAGPTGPTGPAIAPVPTGGDVEPVVG
jgi:EmrB/QacA subfamily drug resistance transporter